MSAEKPAPAPVEPTQEEIEEVEELHKFWSVQPVMKPGEQTTSQGYIDQSLPTTAPPDQASLPAGFAWSTVDINDDAQLTEVFNFLKAHYVEDDDHRFRFLLSPALLKWALTIPGAFPEWIFGVRTKTGVLAGFISGVPYRMRLEDDVQPWCSVNFLCVHSKLRSKNLAPVLIFELARRVRHSKIYRAIFSGDEIPSKAFCESFYHHRPLNLKKMSASDFYPIDPKRMSSAQKRFALPPLVHRNCRPFCEEDVEGVTALLKETSSQFKFDIDFTPELVRHMFMPREDVLYSYVIPGTTADAPKAFFSFYIMNWNVIHDTSGSMNIRAAYIWFHAEKGVDLKSLIADLLNKAVNDAKADVANSVGITGIHEALVANKFESGSKALKYYSYNYAVPDLEDFEMRYIFV